jgi:hypothetical protein
MATIKIMATKDYRMFVRNADNRPVDLAKHRNLKESMREYGFLRSFPLSVVRTDDGRWMVKDGQHRLEIAEQLGIQVYWVEEVVDYDVARVNSTPKPWQLLDYVRTQAVNGSKDCQEVVEFMERHKVSCGLAAALLAGVTNVSPASQRIMDGTFKVKDRDYAAKVVSTYQPVASMTKQVRNSRFLEACMACCRVDGFDPDRLVTGAKKCREKLASYSTRDAYLGMMEEVYNYGRKTLVPLKISAITAMRERNLATKGKPLSEEMAAGL